MQMVVGECTRVARNRTPGPVAPTVVERERKRRAAREVASNDSETSVRVGLEAANRQPTDHILHVARTRERSASRIEITTTDMCLFFHFFRHLL